MSNKMFSIIANNKTLKAQILAALSQAPMSCYDLEDALDRTHQSVSGSISVMVKRGDIEICDFTKINKFNNEVRVYRLPRAQKIAA